MRLQRDRTKPAPGHVNNVTYNRYAESARINWAQKYAVRIDPAHRQEWSGLWTSKGDGLILRSIRTDFKFVRRLERTPCSRYCRILLTALVDSP